MKITPEQPVQKIGYTSALLILVLGSCSFPNGFDRGVAGSGEDNPEFLEKMEETRKAVVVSNNKYRELVPRFKFGNTVSEKSYRGFSSALGSIKRLERFKDRQNGIYVEALCGSYEETKRMAVKKNVLKRFSCHVSGGWVCPYEVIAECDDGRVLQYFSPYKIDFFTIDD